MGDFQVDDWMELIDKDLNDITFKDQGGRFDDELIFLSTQKQSPKPPFAEEDQTIQTDKSEDSILNTLDCRSLKEESDSEESKVIDYSKLMDEQNMFDLFGPIPANQTIGNIQQVSLDACNLAKHLVSQSLSKGNINDFMQQLLVLMNPKISSRQFQVLGKKLAILKHQLKIQKRVKTKQPKVKKTKEGRQFEEDIM